MAQPEDNIAIVSLKCTTCGAPLPDSGNGSEYIKCEYCGTTQKIIDSRQYIDSFRGELYAWLQGLIPSGAAGSATADPVARHNIFVFNVKPRVMADYISMRSHLTMLLSKGMFYLPFSGSISPGGPDSSKKAFESLARIQSVEQLAVNDDDRAFYQEVVSTYTLYSYTLIMADLLPKKDGMSFLEKNFESMLKVLEASPTRKAEYLRMAGLSRGYRALDRFKQGDTAGCARLAAEGIAKLEDSMGEMQRSVSSAIYRPAITGELCAMKALLRLNDTMAKLAGSGRSPADILPDLERYVALLDRFHVENKIACEELIESWCQAVEAKNGMGKVDSMGMSGDILIPFWEVSLTYTFKTGAILWAKGVKVEDKLLVAATYPLAREPVTDIFKTNGEAALMDRLSGNETTMTGSGIKGLVAQIAPNPIPAGTKVFPPIVSNEMAESVAGSYLAQVGRRYGGKLTFGTVKAERLVYLPATINGGRLVFAYLGASAADLDPYIGDIIGASL
jgi:DNA-directed RNA polymerase subunit RPC12/RpoP